MSAFRVFWYALRGGQEDALRDLREHEARLAGLRNLGADIDARVRDATLLEAAAVPTEGVDVIVQAFARGVLAPEDVTRLRDLGISITPVIDWVRRNTPIDGSTSDGHLHRAATASAETEEVSQ